MRYRAHGELLPSDMGAPDLRMRTLINLRWLALVGQSIAIFVAQILLDLRLPLTACFVIIGASALMNIALMSAFPKNHRIYERGAFLSLLFDMAQLFWMIFFTGGLTNTFALLILAPVTISASTLSLRATITLGLIAISLVSVLRFFNYPIVLPDGDPLVIEDLAVNAFWASVIVGMVFIAFYAARVAKETRSLGQALLATQMALAREQKLTDLGGVVAAAAHELGTPLATITLVSSELMGELKGDDALYEDAKLIRQQADRCRDILRDMGSAGKDDLQMRQVPLSELVREAAEPHMARGRDVIFDRLPPETVPEPMVQRSPGVVHGLRNFIQNAVDFSWHRVWIELDWSDERVFLRIVDDGPGYPESVIHRIGDPYISTRREPDSDSERPGYEGMGLGLFIAKTLLERSGAALKFENASAPHNRQIIRPDRSGAMIEITWPAARILAKDAPLGVENPHF